MSKLPEPVILVIADISGYTRYMTANAKTLGHSQTIITELVKTIVERVALPLEVAKLEGDAVFLFARRERESQAWAAQRKGIGEQLFCFFDEFRAKLSELSFSTTCTCNACAHIDRLRLKIVVHSGEALFHEVANFRELAGPDVILVHRLLKNSVAGDEYLLLTEQARRDIELPGEASLHAGRERYEDFGEVQTAVCFPNPAGSPAVALQPSKSFISRFVAAWKLMMRLWFKPVALMPGSGTNGFQHIESSSTPAGQFGMGLLTLLLTPIYLPLSTLIVFARSFRKSPLNAVLPGGHVHSTDGSCCGTAHSD